MRALLLIIIFSSTSSIQAQYFELRKPILLFKQEPKLIQFNFNQQIYNKKVNQTIYFGKKWEIPSHIILHFLIGLWRVDYSIAVAILIEAVDSANGRFEPEDITTRLGGAFLAFLVKEAFLKG